MRDLNSMGAAAITAVRQAVAATEEGRGSALLLTAFSSPPCLQTLAHEPLQGAPRSSKPLCNRFGLLTWQKDDFSSFPSRARSAAAQGRIRQSSGALKTAPLSQQLWSTIHPQTL